jgi:excisionase family DNA binding protein
MTTPTPPPAASAGVVSVLDGERRVQLPLREAAERMGISYWLALKLAHSGELPTHRQGSKLYVPTAVLLRIEQGLPFQGGGVA